MQSMFRLIDSNVYDYCDDTPDSGSDENSAGSSKKGNHQFMIQLFGINEIGETASIFIRNFSPFFFCKVPDQWKPSSVSSFLADIKKRMPKCAYSILSAELVDAHKLYGFTGGKKDRFVKLTFANASTMNRVKSLWYSGQGDDRRLTQFKYGSIKIDIYEGSIPPLLRYFHIHQISPSGWIEVLHPILCETRTTTCKYEYISNSEDVIPLLDKETAVPYKICSFDIEASSSHGDFPLPVKSYKRLASNIADVFCNQPKMAESRAQDLLKKLVLAGFNYGTFAGIDRIYPIEQPTKASLEKCISRLIELPIPKSIHGEINTIESMFKRMKEEDDDDEEGESSSGISAITESNIVQVLLNGNIKRDDKIALLNTMMGSCLPKIKGDEVTFIGSTFMRYGEKEPYLNHCLVVGSCDEVSGAVIQTAATEKELLLQWTEVIQRENPDIIIGYNIFGFDYEFMFRRAIENNCAPSFLSLSRKIDEICAKEITRMGQTTYDIENTKIVLASGEYDLRYFKMSGRLQIDMYSYFRRDFNLSSYKLDDVAGQYISDDVKYVELADNGTTELWSKNLMGLHIGDYIHIEITGFSNDYYQNGRKFVVENIVTKEREEGDKMVKYNVIIIRGEYPDIPKKNVRWGMAKDDVTPQDIFRLSKGSSADRAVVAKYCIQDCNLVHHLMNKIDVITGYVEMSRICSVPISFLVFRGQGIKLTSYVAKKCREKNTLMPDLQKSKAADGYEGAIVLPPKCGMYMDNPVACVDYSSLYPSNMISQNYSHDSKVWSKEYDLDGNLIKETGEKDRTGKYVYDNLPEYQYIDVEFDTYAYLRKSAKSSEVKTKVGKMIVRWAQLPDGQKSIMPSILEELLKARANTRKMIKTEPDPFMQNILDKRQLGYKVTANSLYGQCGAKTSTFYEKDVAACTTATGRLMITYAKRMIEEVYGDSIYETAALGPVQCRAEYVYGDSVANYTPVKVRVNGQMEICTIEELAKYGNYRWVKCEEPGKQTKEFCELKEGIESWTEIGWTKIHRIIRHILAPHKRMFRIITDSGSQIDATDDHSLLSPSGEAITPNICSLGTKLLSCDWNNHESVAASFECVKCCWIIPRYKGFVYDLTTENHHFAAGIGNLIVHNTDSVFFTFNLENPQTKEKIRGKPALEATIEIAQDVANLCTSYLKPPMALTYEKTLMPFILLSKKRYVGMLYEENPNKGKLKFMGLVLKRRDNCDLVKDVYGGILDILMKPDASVQLAIDFLNRSLQDLIDGKTQMDKLMITKALRSDYKNPQTIAHRVLADRMGQRDPGNKPKPGDRIKYIYVTNPGAKLQGDKIETPEYAIDSKLKIDYVHYITNQLMKPLQQLFGLALEQIWETQGKKPAIMSYRKDMRVLEKESGGDLEEFMKKKEKYCAAKVKTLLFDTFLTKVNQSQNGIRTLDQFWGPK